MANVLLSIILVRPYGIVGDALGTAIPLTATMLFCLPQHLCCKLQVPIRTFLRDAYTVPILTCAPVIVVLLLMKRWFVPHNYWQLLIHLAAAGLVYGLCLAWAFASDRAMKVGDLHTFEDAFPSSAGAQKA